ncbi:uncharacterized protein LOC130761296 [Actinidia eriantha]|uniref:uncharacterized protein LOC130761296 n=1 Tax=Actinidia eriantha TaxID=165200 RepID=UPI00258913CA|nr:uncharacterized protein LOC130761296 [Actinidia eriantha]
MCSNLASKRGDTARLLLMLRKLRLKKPSDDLNQPEVIRLLASLEVDIVAYEGSDPHLAVLVTDTVADNPSKFTKDTTPPVAVGQAVNSVSYASLVPLCKNTFS